MNKKNLNRVLSLVLTLVLVLSCLPGRAYAAESASGTTGDCTWSFDGKTGTFTVSGNGAMADYPYDSGQPWNNIRKSVTSLEIKEGVTSIGEYALAFFENVETVVIPASVEVLSSSAFHNCTALKLVTFAEGSKLTRIEGAFSFCKSLEQITIPAGVTDIATGDDSAFYLCSSLTDIIVPEDNLNYKDIDGVLYSKDGKILYCYPSGKPATSFTTPQGVEKIATFAFVNIDTLESVTLSEGLKIVERYAFVKQSSIFGPSTNKHTKVWLPMSVTQIHYSAFSGRDLSVHYCDTEEVFKSKVTILGGQDEISGCIFTCRTDNDLDHFCDSCGYELSRCSDADGDYFCDYCGILIPPTFKITSRGLFVSYNNGQDWTWIGSVADGKSVESIRKTETNGNIDTYTITYSDGSTSTFTVTNGKDGADGVTPQFKVENSILYVSYDEGQTWTSLGSLKGDKGDQGEQGEQGDKGETGNGIAKIEKTSSEGLVDTYTITYTDGTTATFTVTNGAQGIQGIQGEKGDKGDAPVITIQNGNWYIDGVDSGVAATGIKGDTGNGISDISMTKTEGLVDTYTVTYTDGTITTFTVTNGEKGDKGDQGEQGIQGVPGKDGHTPVITIVDGYWHIDGVNTNILAVGAKGEDGKDGVDGKDGKDGLNGKDGKDGADGKDGKDGITPKLRINDDNIWEVSYDNGQTWESLGVAASGADGVTPQLRINGDTNMWEVSYDNGETWTSMGVVATGADGKDGGSVLPIVISCSSLAGMVIMFCVMMADRKKKAYAGR